MCHTAQLNGLATSGVGNNCNIPNNIQQDESINQQGYVFEKKLQFVAQEIKPFHINDSNTQFVYMTTIRNPMDRVYSHLHHDFCVLPSIEDTQARLTTHGCVNPLGTFSDLISDSCFDNGPMRYMTTDYYLAMLTGCTNRNNIRRVPSFPPPEENTCSEDHLEEAKRILNYFSVILISDNSAELGR
jgi:hypothetical protein